MSPLIEPIIRPPAEADSLLLQVTVGCSANSCSFCAAYRNKNFRIVNNDIVVDDIRKAARRYPETRKVFLLDGDALVLSTDRLVPILKLINESFPKLMRISSYANGYNIIKKSQNELRELAKNKLTLIYMGLESGSQKVLDACDKRSTVDEMVEAVKKAQDVGIKSSVIVLLGLGGKAMSKEHITGTIGALNRMQPRYLSFLSLMLINGTSLGEQAASGEFKELSSVELLKEAREIIEGLNLEKTIFRSNHASNYLELEGRFPKDKNALLSALDAAISGEVRLKPDWFRGL